MADKRFEAIPEKEDNIELRKHSLEKADLIADRIIELTSIASPTGYTLKAQEYLMKTLTGFGLKPWKTNKGTVYCELNKNAAEKAGDASPEDAALLISAHCDTLGLVVRHIKPDGRLRLKIMGGYPLNYVEQENVYVHTRCGKTYEGTVRLINPAIHASREINSTQRDDSNCELVLDQKVKNREDVEKLGIRAGDFISLDARAKRAGDGFIKSRHLDDKASAAMLLTLAEEVAQGKVEPKRKTYIAFTMYEEIGHGAAAGHPVGIKDMLALDMGVVGTDLDTDEYTLSICAADSSGPYDYGFTNALIKLSEEKELKFAVDIYPFYGSDASAAMSAGHDFRAALAGTGVAASHGYERVHEEGICNTYTMVRELIQITLEDFEAMF